ncbi:iron-siderophore ABC transporter substrate-binding protein [Amycolatopsis nigrescens]|uniref:iron-siderophore ABC transporter substrate-binding protein n=1 Tax=Amycolatopsis nigrescens TaxID=381445 RepID=UPI0003697E17|nr:iron-siderophore ABC transporter substrate-binding protein [Amycolatopsis nigrescens]
MKSLNRTGTSRLAALVTSLVLGAGLVTACGADRATSGAPGAGDATGFPVQIDHRFGSTKIEKKPSRIVALGGGDMEASIALDVVPVAGADWFGYNRLRNWVKDGLGDRQPPELIMASQPNFEQIAALRPDLILYVNSVNDKNQYDTLARIAPTIAAPADVRNVYGVYWQDQVRTIAKATGTTAKGEEVVQRTQGLLDDAAKAHPEFAGKVITAGVFSSGEYSVWMPSDPRMRLLRSLGFRTNPKIDALDDGSFYVRLPDEQLDKLNADLILLAAQDQTGAVDPSVTANPLFATLPAVQARHVVYFGGAGVINSGTESAEFSSAFSIGGPLGIKYVLDKLVPKLQAGITGA